MSSPVRIDPEFERYCKDLKKNIEKSLKLIIPDKEIKITNVNIQKIIANMNKENGTNIKIKKIGKRNRYKLIPYETNF